MQHFFTGLHGNTLDGRIEKVTSGTKNKTQEAVSASDEKQPLIGAEEGDNKELANTDEVDIRSTTELIQPYTNDRWVAIRGLKLWMRRTSIESYEYQYKKMKMQKRASGKSDKKSKTEVEFLSEKI